MKRKVAVFFHEKATQQLLDGAETPDLGTEFYQNSQWGRRPNSTVRLSVVNLKALLSLSDKFVIEFRTEMNFDEDLATELKKFDLLVVNSIANVDSIKFAGDLAVWARDSETAPRVIIGTEATWEAELKRGNIDQSVYDAIYFGNLLLRHTARTDRAVYASNDCVKAQIQEFELGIDTDAFPNPTPILDRRKIVLVKAPEGRKTKNNEDVEKFVSLIKADPVLAEMELQIVEPPYAITDYWAILAESAFLFFTSLGETFSYALNDAKALGVVTFYPEQMYFTTIGRRFSVDAYPYHGVKYTSLESAVSQASEMFRNPEQLVKASAHSVASVNELFALKKVTENWQKLFDGETLCTESLYLADTRGRSYGEVSAEALQYGCRFVLDYMNRSMHPIEQHFSRVDWGKNLVWIQDFVHIANDGQMLRVMEIGDDGRIRFNLDGSPVRFNAIERVPFLQLICRSYKVSKIYIDSSLETPDLVNAVEQLTYVANFDNPNEQIQVEILR